MDILEYVGTIYEKNNKDKEGMSFNILTQYSRYTEQLMLFGIYAYVGATVSHFALTLLECVLSSERKPLYGYFMRGIDVQTNTGISMLNMFAIVSVILGAIILFAYEITTFAVMLNMMMLSSIIVDYLEELSKTAGSSNFVDEHNIRRRFISIIHMNWKYTV